MSQDDDDKTPAGKRPPFGGPDAADIADTGIALSTVATRLHHSADLADAAAAKCSEAARMGDDYSTEDRQSYLRDIEDDLITLADAIHATIRALREARLEMRGRH